MRTRRKLLLGLSIGVAAAPFMATIYLYALRGLPEPPAPVAKPLPKVQATWPWTPLSGQQLADRATPGSQGEWHLRRALGVWLTRHWSASRTSFSMGEVALARRAARRVETLRRRLPSATGA